MIFVGRVVCRVCPLFPHFYISCCWVLLHWRDYFVIGAGSVLKIIPVILSGGIGSRLWPLSRDHFPKQRYALVDAHYSLLQQTMLRTLSLDVADPKCSMVNVKFC
ncbi:MULTISPECIES: sugar phosphate nucleotidyltransferase [Marinomonas]|uniref:sugar phosphate nucleotidyltransferase n=1 Tax=Marinomonas TaxID=28253 RepID=UPI0019B52047|nr:MULTISPECIES: sugar phosphate nucleotidyltransferase [Marinomonas]GGN37350.1 hypothetical protein GCM10011350_36430 [Marinomonas arctica]